MRGQVESRVALLTAQTEASTVDVVDALPKRVTQVAAHSAEQMMRVVGAVFQKLEKEIEASAVSAATAPERHTRSAVERLSHEVKAQM